MKVPNIALLSCVKIIPHLQRDDALLQDFAVLGAGMDAIYYHALALLIKLLLEHSAENTIREDYRQSTTLMYNVRCNPPRVDIDPDLGGRVGTVGPPRRLPLPGPGQLLELGHQLI